jgi:hypothetical protein
MVSSFFIRCLVCCFVRLWWTTKLGNENYNFFLLQGTLQTTAGHGFVAIR